MSVEIYNNVKKMLARRGYKNIEKIEKCALPEVLNQFYIQDNETMVLFITTNEKITIKFICNIIATCKHNNIILIHNSELTNDAVKNILENSIFHVETFTFNQFCYDYFEIIFENPNETNIEKVDKIKEWNKVSILLTTDPLARYMGLRDGDFVLGKFSGTNEISYRRVKTC